MADSKCHVFLSHNWDDKPVVEELARRLQREGIEPWLDKWHLIPGASWQPAIEQALAGCATCAVLIGPSGIGSWQHEEMRAAIDRRVKEHRNEYRVIPVILPGAQRPEKSRVPDFLASTTWVEFRHSLEDEDAFHRLVCGIRGTEPGSGSGEAVYEGVCPYRGLEAFDEAHAKFFFGREARTDWLVDSLRPPPAGQENRFLAIIGPSGSGKSSLALAGLVPALRQGRIDGSADWPVAICHPHNDPLESLAVALARVNDGAPSPSKVRQLIRELREAPNGMHLFARLAFGGAPSRQRLMVLVDQFEEVFTLCQDEALRRAFIENMIYAASTAGGQTIVVLTLRADFYGKCASYTDLAASLADHQDLVGPMTEEELHRAIERPARLVGCEFEPSLVERLVQDVKDQSGALPLLQYALLELWKEREGRRFTYAAYRAMGGLQGALENRANATLRSFSEAERELCRRIFLRLTQPGEGTEDTKRRVSFRELASSRGDVEDLDEVIRRLADARLVTTEGDRRHPSERFVEVAHEALVRGWSELRRWIEADRAGLQTHRRLTEAAREWESSGRDLSYLYEGARLAVAREWAWVHRDDLNLLEEEFLATSDERQDRRAAEELKAARRLAEEAEARRLAEEERAVEAERGEKAARAMAVAERKRRRATVALVISIFTMAMLTVGGWSWYQQQERDRWLRSKGSAERAFSEAERLGELALATSDLTRWAEAIKSLEGAQRLLESGGADEALQSRMSKTLEAFRGQADALAARERDGRIVTRLEDARLLAVGSYKDMLQQETKDNPGSRLVIDGFRKAIKEYGIDLEDSPPQDAVTFIQSKPREVREAIAAALDDWVWREDRFIKDPNAQEHTSSKLVPNPRVVPLIKIAREVDPDPQRNAIRDATLSSETWAHAMQLRQLVRGPDIDKNPIATLLLLGKFLRGQGDYAMAVKLLLPAQRLHPGDFWINYDLASALISALAEETSGEYRHGLATEASRYLAAALAIRPGNSAAHFSLGNVLRIKGDRDGAIAAFHTAIALEPGLPEAHYFLGVSLYYKGKFADALTSLKKGHELGSKVQPFQHGFSASSIRR